MKQLVFVILFLPFFMLSQNKLNGMIMQPNENNKPIALPGANVYWLNTTIGAVTDIDGKFSISYEKEYSKLVISYVGFKTDTITVNEPKMIHHLLQPTSELDEVSVTARKQATSKSYLQATNTFTVSSDELLKAACCNL